jgi:hypothetical protein
VSLLACSWLSPPRPGFRRAFTPEPPPVETRGARRLDPWPFGWTKRRSSTSATNTAREHTHRPPEPRLQVKRACARARRPPASPSRSRRLPRRARSKRFSFGLARRQQPHLENGWHHRAGSHPRCPSRGRDPCGLREPRRMRLGPHPTTRRDVDVNRAPSGCADGHQPRFHGPGAGMLCCQRSLVRSDARAVPRTQPSAHRHPSQMPVRGHPRGRLGETSTPTRSTRTPLVMRSGHRWVENSNGARHRSGQGAAPSTISPHEPHPREG